MVFAFIDAASTAGYLKVPSCFDAAAAAIVAAEVLPWQQFACIA